MGGKEKESALHFRIGGLRDLYPGVAHGLTRKEFCEFFC